jgi:hypothetical protein
MRKVLISLLLASAVASPAFAEPDHDGEGRRWEHRQQSGGDQGQAREDRGQSRDQYRGERSAGDNGERPQFSRPERPQPQFVQPQQSYGGQQSDYRQRGDGVSRWNRDNNQQAGETSRWTRDPTQRSGETSRWTRDRNGWAGDGNWRQSDQAVPNVMRSPNPVVVNRDRRDGAGDRLRDRSRWASGGWDRNWRNDRRYDWRRYRDSHRSTFHIGIYYDPFGFGYRPFDIGYNLGPQYYSQRYWIDPAMYSLPYPPPGTQWVRYWNDALLVDLYTGEVVDVIRGFFW